MASHKYISAIEVLSESAKAIDIQSGGLFVQKDIHLNGALSAPLYSDLAPGHYSLIHFSEHFTCVAMATAKSGASSAVYISVTYSGDKEPPNVTYHTVGEFTPLDELCIFDGTLYGRVTETSSLRLYIFGSDTVTDVHPVKETDFVNVSNSQHVLRIASPLMEIQKSRHKAIQVDDLTVDQLTFSTMNLGSPQQGMLGTRQLLYPTSGKNSLHYAIGVEPDNMWFSVENATSGFKWYCGTGLNTDVIEPMRLTGTGALSIRKSVHIGSGFDEAVNTGGLHIAGVSRSLDGPHLSLSTSAPRLHCLAWDEDDICIGFDAFYNGREWKPTSKHSSFFIHKRQTELVVMSLDGSDQRDRRDVFSIHCSGQVKCSGPVVAKSVQAESVLADQFLIPITPVEPSEKDESKLAFNRYRVIKIKSGYTIHDTQGFDGKVDLVEVLCLLLKNAT